MKNKKKDNIISFPTSPTKLERQVEAILFAASEPLDVETIEKRVQTTSNLKKILENLQETYKNRGINLVRKKTLASRSPSVRKTVGATIAE